MLDTLVDEDAGNAIRAAADAATAAGTPARAAAAEIATPPALPAPDPPPVFDEVTTALPRPAELEGADDAVPATILMSAAAATPADTDTVPVPPPAGEPEPPTVLMPPPLPPPAKKPARPPAAAAPPPPPPAAANPSPADEAGPTILMTAPASPEAGSEKTVLMPALGAAAAARATRPPAARPPAPPPGPIVEAPPTVLMSAPSLAPPPPPARPPRPAAAVATGAMPAPAVPAPAGRRGGRTGLLVAGGALFLLMAAAAVAGLLMLRGGADPVADAQTPPTVAPTVPPSTLAALAPTPEPEADVLAISGSVRVVTQPPGATVTVDGVARGASPLDVPELALGAHEVRAELRGYAPAIHKVILTAESPQADVSLTLGRAAPVSVMVEAFSNPSGALVRIDGIAVGQTPLRQAVRVGSHSVEMIKEGFEPWTGSLEVPTRGTPRLNAALRPVPRATPVPEQVDVARVYALSEVDTQPRRLAGGSAPYPERAPRLRPGRDVTVAGTFVVAEDGSITDLRITESAGEMVDEAVAAAVRNWKYAPGAKKGVKVKVRIAFKQTFRAG
jgi:TonB family protein